MTKRILALIIILIIFITGCTNVNDVIINHEDNKASELTTETEVYSPDLIKKDIREYKLAHLGVHFGLGDEKRMHEFSDNCDNAIKSIDKPMTKDELFFILSKLSVPLEDGHEILYYNDEKYFLPLYLKWIDEGLVVIKSDCELEKGDKIIEINGKQIDSVLNEFKNIISTENIYWVKNRASKLITAKYMLNYLVGINNDDSISMKS